jgi:hypothetical protein
MLWGFFASSFMLHAPCCHFVGCCAELDVR